MRDYIDWAKRETAQLADKPHTTIRGWRSAWVGALGDLVTRDAVYELCSIIVARWEFLGSLHVGHPHKESNQDQAVKYAHEFLAPLNSSYAAKHPRILTGMTTARLLFDMLRNKSLHGFTPAAVFDRATTDCIVWSCKNKGTKTDHMRFIRPNAWPGENALHIDGETFLDDFSKSMEAFAVHLETNQGAPTPAEKFKTGVWWKLHPKDFPSGLYSTWGVEGP